MQTGIIRTQVQGMLGLKFLVSIDETIFKTALRFTMATR